MSRSGSPPAGSCPGTRARGRVLLDARRDLGLDVPDGVRDDPERDREAREEEPDADEEEDDPEDQGEGLLPVLGLEHGSRGRPRRPGGITVPILLSLPRTGY